MLLLAFMLQTFNKNLVILDFYSNRSELASKYCVNKNRPKLHCNGQCFLMKMLKKEEKKEKDLESHFHKLEIIAYQCSFITFPSATRTIDTPKLSFAIPRNSRFRHLNLSYSLLKPPIGVNA